MGKYHHHVKYVSYHTQSDNRFWAKDFDQWRYWSNTAKKEECVWKIRKLGSKSKYLVEKHLKYVKYAQIIEKGSKRIEAVVRRCSVKKLFSFFRKFHRKTVGEGGGVSAKSDISKQKKYWKSLNYSSRYGAKKRPNA